MDKQKNNMTTDIFSQRHENPLARGREMPLKIFSQRRKKPPTNQSLRLSRQSIKQVFAVGKVFSR